MIKNDNSNQRSYSKDEDFMQSIYNKVSALRQNLESYQTNSPLVKKSIDGIRNSQMKSHHPQNKIELLNFNFKPKLNVVTLNDQSKVHRQSLILKLKIQQQPQHKFNKTSLGFSQTYRNNPILPQKIQINSKQRSLSSFNLPTNTGFNKTNNFSKTYTKKQGLAKRYFSSKQLPPHQNICKKQNQMPLKIDKNQIQKGRTQNKMSRLAGFLDKYDNRSLKNQMQQQMLKYNNLMQENQEVADKQNKIENQVGILDSDQKFDHFHVIESLKEEKRELEQKQTFKPIGSANGLRKSTNKNQYTMNSDQESNQVHHQLSETAENAASVIKERLSSPDRESALRKNYLEKGNKFRQVLFKKLLKQDAKTPQEMIYVKDYDQWVPSKLIENNRKQLQSYMKMLLGEKKQQNNTNKLTLNNVDLLYY